MKAGILLLLISCVFAIQVKDRTELGARLPPRDCLDCELLPGGSPSTKPSTNSPPEFAMQFKPPLGCLPASALNSIVGNIKKQIPTADIHTTCNGSLQNIGVWRTQPTTLDPSSARDTGTSKLNILNANETFAMTITSTGYLKSVASVWNSFPKAYDSSGNPNPSGPVFLKSYSLVFLPPSSIVLTINGEAKGVTFHLVSIDSLALVGGKVSCGNSAKLDIDKTFLDVLLGLAFIFAPVFTPPLIDLEHLASSYSNQGGNYLPGEAKCSLGAVIPNSIPLSPFLPGQKADFKYTRLLVSPNGGIEVGGTFGIVPRTPSFEIWRKPSATIRTDFDSPAAATFTLEPTDVVPPLTVTWSAPGAVKASGTTTFGASVMTPKIALSWTALNSTYNTKTVTFTLKDVDQKSATKSTTVPITRTMNGDAPICDKPKGRDLPQCN